MRNLSVVTEFILLGIPHTEGLETMLLVLFLSFYIFTLMGNLLILLAIVSSTRLHKPMYFFLGKLSIFDIFFPSVSSPKMLCYLSGNSQAISYAGCASQLFFYHFLGCTECFLYTVMAYDRFVAICHPLHYTLIMSHRACIILAMGTSFFACIQATFLTILTFQLPYCGPNEVDYYFCDIPVMLKLACADTSALEMVGFISVGLMPLSCFLLIFTSYSTSFAPSCRSTLPRADAMPSPPAAPTSLPSSSPLCQWFSSTCSPPPILGLMQLFKS
ncbi:hypothetical protein H8958_006688 [Nasalis larvatus]